MADKEDRKRRKRSRSCSSDSDRDRKPRSSSKSSSRSKKLRQPSDKKSRSRSRSVSASSHSEHDHKSRKKRRNRSSISTSSSSGERKKKHKKRLKKSATRRKSRSCSRSRSSLSSRSSSGSNSSSSSSDSEYERKKTKKSKHKTTKKKKKRKKKKKTRKTSHAVNQYKYGKYGILSESDQFTKQPEFYCWLQEARQVNPEALPRLETKKMFETFMEDYNTATLPHKKYYNLAKWEMKHNEKKRLKEIKKAKKNYISFADDESKHTMKFKGEEKRYGLSKERILEMKRAIKERTEQEYKKNVGFDQSARK